MSEKGFLVEGKWWDLLYAYQFIRRLVTPFNKTKAFELGIIDATGKVLKKRESLVTPEEKNAYTYFDTLVFNLKKLLGLLPFGKTLLASITAALLLLKEERNLEFQMIQEQDNTLLDLEYNKLYTYMLENQENYRDSIRTIRSMLNEEKLMEEMTTASVPTTQEPIMSKDNAAKYKRRNIVDRLIRRNQEDIVDGKNPVKKIKKEIKESIESLIDVLNKSIADEWLAIFLYTNSSMITDCDLIKKEFIQHAQEEHTHIEILLSILKDLGGKNKITPDNTSSYASITYYDPKLNNEKLLDQNIEWEHKAIKAYEDLLHNFDLSKVHRKKIEIILDKEREHIKDLKKLK